MSSPNLQEEHKESSPTEDLPEGGGPSSSSPDDSQIDAIRRNFYQKLMVCEAQRHTEMEDSHEDVQLLEEVTVDGIIKYIQSEKCTNIITLAGAGISTAAGIPDFRSPGSGLYHNLQKYNLPEPQAIFDIGYFSHNPEPFFTLAKELLPGKFKPTVSHYFIRLLQEKGLLLRHYTQNIDTLERVAGLPESHLIEAHGSFHISHCIQCRKEYSVNWNKHFADCTSTTMVLKCEDCEGIVKPDIVFFGEKLPDRFHDCMLEDFDKCDLLIIMGSSLEVQPFASLIDKVPSSCPRLLINRERTGVRSGGLELRARALLESLLENHTLPSESLLAGLHILLSHGGLMLGQEENNRDVEWLGDCDVVCQMLAEKLGWGDDLQNLVKSEREKLELENNMPTPTPASPLHPPSSL